MRKLTKQGVRALGWEKKQKKIILPRECDHRQMRWCCAPRNCGHLVCKCGFAWDEAKELYW